MEWGVCHTSEDADCQLLQYSPICSVKGEFKQTPSESEVNRTVSGLFFEASKSSFNTIT